MHHDEYTKWLEGPLRPLDPDTAKACAQPILASMLDAQEVTLLANVA
jgi:hypothetical protein